MEFNFNVGNVPAQFVRNWLTGRASLRVAGKEETLQNPWSPFTHFSLRTCRSWQKQIAGHDVTIERVRQLVFNGIAPCKYRAFVDGQIVSEAVGP